MQPHSIVAQLLSSGLQQWTLGTAAADTGPTLSTSSSFSKTSFLLNCVSVFSSHASWLAKLSDYDNGVCDVCGSLKKQRALGSLLVHNPLTVNTQLAC